jgi:hypothetical protein
VNREREAWDLRAKELRGLLVEQLHNDDPLIRRRVDDLMETQAKALRVFGNRLHSVENVDYDERARRNTEEMQLKEDAAEITDAGH